MISSSLTIKPKKEREKIVDFLKRTFRQQKINRAVISLSGGVDSTTCLYLLKEALQPENIFIARLDYFYRPDKTVKWVLQQSKLPKQNLYKISIKPVVDEFIKIADVEGKGIPTARSRGVLFEASTDGNEPETGPATVSSFSKIRIGNLMTRVRMIILFDLAKKHNALVCGTENKTEHLLGYYTRFGDEASDIEPIRHLYKTQVYQLAKYLEVPQKIIAQKPTAGLWTGQTDEKEFGFTYKEADQVLFLYFDKKISTEKIVKMGYPNARKVIAFVEKNSFKLKTPYYV